MAGTFWGGFDDFLESELLDVGILSGAVSDPRMPFPQPVLPPLPNRTCHHHHFLTPTPSLFGHGSTLHNPLGTSLPRASDLWPLRPGIGHTQISWPGSPARSNLDRLALFPRHARPPSALCPTNILPLPIADSSALLTPPATIGPPWAAQTFSASPALPAFSGPSLQFPREPNSDDIFLEALVSQSFSSPSIRAEFPEGHAPSSRPSSPNRTTSSGAASWVENRTRGTGLAVANLITKAEQSGGNSSPLPLLASEKNSSDSNMPPSTRKRRLSAAIDRRPLKRARQSPGLRTPLGQTKFMIPRRGGIGYVKSEEDNKQPETLLDSDGEEVIDLIDDELPASLKTVDVDNHVKISAFQCVICMENVTDLTVTHCGHLFCSECLHQSLNVDPTKKVCPICRQKIDVKPGADGKFAQKAKGFYQLELKLMTPKRLGKLKAR